MFRLSFACLLFFLQTASQLWARDLDEIRSPFYGPSLEQELFSEFSPVLSPLFLPRANYRAFFHWKEPLLGTGVMGHEVQGEDTYFSYSSGLLLSPYYGGLGASIGLRLIPFFELRLAYDFLAYLGTNLEMDSNRDTSLALQNTWQTDRVLDRLYTEGAYDYIQTFQFHYIFAFQLASIQTNLGIVHTFLDVNSDNYGRSLEYNLGLPIYRQDNLLEVNALVQFPLNSTVNLLLGDDFVTTGFAQGIFASRDVESIQRNAIKLGLSWKPTAVKKLSMQGALAYLSRTGDDEIKAAWDHLSIQLRIQHAIFYLENPERKRRTTVPTVSQ